MSLKNWIRENPKTLTIVMSLTAAIGLAFGAFGVMNSDLFIVRVVEVSDLSDPSPIDTGRIVALANVPLDSVNLFSLRLRPIEQRLLAHPWIKGVTISKRFPQTVSISVQFREPAAIVQSEGGELEYADTDGTLFSRINLKSNPNIPVLIGFAKDRVPETLRWISQWNESELGKMTQISSLEWDAERGLRVMVIYPFQVRGKGEAVNVVGRVMVELGQSFDVSPASGTDERAAQLARLKEVISYLREHGINARQVFADLGKKIVVRIARSS